MRYLAVGLLLAGLSACVSSSYELQQQLRPIQSSLADLRNFQAEQTTEISTLQTQVRELAGRIERLEHSQRYRLDTALGAVQRDVTQMQQRVPPPPVVPELALDEDEVFVSRREDQGARLVARALGDVRQGKFREAVATLESAVDAATDDEIAGIAWFWLGVSNDGREDLKAALRAYHTSATRFPKHHRVLLALLRQASVFVRLNDAAAAKLTLEKIVADHPNSAEAKMAAERLKDLSQ